MNRRSLSVLKRTRQTEKRRARNRAEKRRLRTAIKQIVHTKTKKTAHKRFPEIQSLIDRSAQDGVIHKKTAARLKSKLEKQIASLR